MKLRTLVGFRVLVGMFVAGALALAGSARAVDTASVIATVSGPTLSVTGSASTSGLPNGTYNAALIVTSSSGQTVISGSNSFTIGGGSMTLTTVDNRTYSLEMSVTTTSPQFCGTYSSPSDVVSGYIAVMSGSTPNRFQLMAPPDSTGRFCANLVLDPGQNTVWAAYVSTAGQLIYATNQLTVNNSATNVAAGSVRIQLTWDKANDMDLHLYSPAAANGIASTSTYGDHIWWSNMTHSWGQLDIDHIDGYGPENITVNSFPTKPGKYLIVVNAYSVGGASTTNCVLTVYTGGGTTLPNGTASFTLTRTGQNYLMGYLNVTASGTYTFETLGTFAGEGMGQIIEPPPGYVPLPKN